MLTKKLAALGGENKLLLESISVDKAVNVSAYSKPLDHNFIIAGVVLVIALGVIYDTHHLHGLPTNSVDLTDKGVSVITDLITKPTSNNLSLPQVSNAESLVLENNVSLLNFLRDLADYDHLAETDPLAWAEIVDWLAEYWL